MTSTAHLAIDGFTQPVRSPAGGSADQGHRAVVSAINGLKAYVGQTADASEPVLERAAVRKRSRPRRGIRTEVNPTLA